ncbi:MAG: hypothetical protein AAFZ65_19305, partial [Planctomycetota bacterium]
MAQHAFRGVRLAPNPAVDPKRLGGRLRPAAGVVTLDVQWIEGGERHVLRYADRAPASAPTEPLWIDRRIRRETDTPASVLRHAVPIIAPHLLAAPARSAHQREGPWSGQKSVDPGRRRGFARAEDARFPRRVFAT